MFKLIRRISYGVIPRPDRPWDEDPTSNAPRTSRKRRLSLAERDSVDDKIGKKVRENDVSPSLVDAEAPFIIPEPDAKEIKEVTQGVDEVELEDKQEGVVVEAVVEPEAVPLPEEKSGELDELASDDGTPVPITACESPQTPAVKPVVALSPTEDCEQPKSNEAVDEHPIESQDERNVQEETSS